MNRDPGRLRAVMATLLVASALLFGVGILVERSTGSSAPPAPPTAPHHEGAGERGGESGEAVGAHTETGGSESMFGIDPEAPPLVAFAIILSLVAAFLVWRHGRRLVIVGAILIALAFAALDLLEINHQAREGTALVAVIAALVAVGHLIAGGLGITIVRRSEAG